MLRTSTRNGLLISAYQKLGTLEWFSTSYLWRICEFLSCCIMYVGIWVVRWFRERAIDAVINGHISDWLSWLLHQCTATTPKYLPIKLEHVKDKEFISKDFTNSHCLWNRGAMHLQLITVTYYLYDIQKTLLLIVKFGISYHWSSLPLISEWSKYIPRSLNLHGRLEKLAQTGMNLNLPVLHNPYSVIVTSNNGDHRNPVWQSRG